MKYSMNVKGNKKTTSGTTQKDTRKNLNKNLNMRAFNPTKLPSGSVSSNQRKKKAYLGMTQSKKKKKKNFKQKIVKLFVIFLGTGFFLIIAVLIVGGLYLKGIERSLPDPSRLVTRSSDQSTLILDREGNELYKIYADQNREFVALDELPDHFRWAILSAEDFEFYNHQGLDLLAVTRAAYANLVLGRVARGASTITQQLIRNTILYDVLGDEAYEQTYARKIKEVLITMQVEQNLSKDEILQMYINEVPFGGVNYGIQAASLAYFAKDAKDLTLAESAMLAGVIASPTNYSPIFGSDPELAVTRQHIVLDLMFRNRAVTGVTEEEISEAKEEELVYASKRIEIDAPHFIFYVKKELEEMYGIDRVERGGLRVKTSLDYSIQQIAEEEIRKGIEEYGKRWNVNNGAMVVLEPRTNQVLAMVGSIDYWNTEDPRVDGNVNVTTSKRQMGSSVKPYTYLSAFHQGYGPWLHTPDIPGFDFGNYRLKNWDSRYYGNMNARQALIQSRNIPAVYTTQLVGIDSFIETAEKLGITSLVNRDMYGLSIGLGAAEISLLEHTGAFSVFANEGIKKPIAPILEVIDSNGEILYEFEEAEGERVFDEKDIYAINWILCDLGGFGDQPMNYNYIINGARVLCGKTGTTDGPRDLSSMMYHRNLVVGVWAGNNNNIEVPGAWSTTVPLPIAHSFMQRISTKYIPESFARPAGIHATSVCKDTGWVAEGDECEKVPSIYIANKVPPKDTRTVIRVCKDNGLIPTNEELAERFELLEDRILFADYEIENKFQVNAYKNYLTGREPEEGSVKFIFEEPDSGECELPESAMAAPTVTITSPIRMQRVLSKDTIDIKFDKVAGIEIESVEVYFNELLIKEGLYTLPTNLPLGLHTITVKVFDVNGKQATDTVQIEHIKPRDKDDDDDKDKDDDDDDDKDDVIRNPVIR